MQTNRLVTLSIITIMLTSFAVIAQEAIKYDFDEVEVVYASEFTAKPVGVAENNWLAQLAGGNDKPVTVLFGVVNLKKNGEVLVREEFIKIGGEVGSKRLLVNSASYDYYEGTSSSIKSINSFFWTAKKLVDNVVVKDFTPPVESVSFYRKFDESKNMYTAVLYTSNDGQASSQSFPSLTSEGYYEADLTTLKQAGDITASSGA